MLGGEFQAEAKLKEGYFSLTERRGKGKAFF